MFPFSVGEQLDANVSLLANDILLHRHGPQHKPNEDTAGREYHCLVNELHQDSKLTVEHIHLLLSHILTEAVEC